MSVKAQDSAGNKLPINMGKGDYRRSYHLTRSVSVFRSLQMIYPLKILMNLRALEKKVFFLNRHFKIQGFKPNVLDNKHTKSELKPFLNSYNTGVFPIAVLLS